jgi:hypothetical protein
LSNSFHQSSPRVATVLIPVDGRPLRVSEADHS